jgi:tRNA acetyltransferase TAN1
LFNLVATTQRGNERACMKELGMLSESLGFESVRLKRTGYPGLVIGLAPGDPVALVKAVRPIAEEDPWDLRFLQKLTPVEANVEATTEDIAEAVAKLAHKVPEGKSFKVSINKRGSDIVSQELIKAAASKVERIVNLERPDWVVQIEIIEDSAGVSILEPKDILSITKLQELAMQGQR